MMRSRIPLILLALPLVLGSGSAVADAISEDPPVTLGEVLSRFDEVQQGVRTLRAGLTMTTHDPLLKDPQVYRGKFYMTVPDQVRWEFSIPEEMRFVIANDLYTGYYPSQKRAERKNIRRWSEQLFRYFGLGRDSTDLGRFYRISLGPEDPDDPERLLLLLEPRKRRARKRVDDVHFWISRSTWLPVRVEYRGVDGARRVVEFEGMELNVELTSKLYEIELPGDVEITTGFHPFGGGS